MMGQAACVRALLLLIFAAAAQSLTFDEDATNDVVAAVQLARDGGEFVILIRGPHGKSPRREELLHAKVADDISMSLFYNRKTNKVTLESLSGGHIKSVSWSFGGNPQGTLSLVATSSRVRILVGCKPLHWHPMSGRHNLLDMLSSQKLKLYHEENAPVEIYSNERSAFESLNCESQEETMRPPSSLTVDEPESDVEEVKDFIEKDARRKREEEMQGDDYRANYIESDSDPNGVLARPTPSRGDIPSNGIESCDDEVIRQLQALRTTIEHLRREIVGQKGIIDDLRGQLRQCCNRVPSPPPVERCTDSSCYPGY